MSVHFNTNENEFDNNFKKLKNFYLSNNKKNTFKNYYQIKNQNYHDDYTLYFIFNFFCK